MALHYDKPFKLVIDISDMGIHSVLLQDGDAMTVALQYQEILKELKLSIFSYT